jgi:CMP/dCMP kinase
VSSRLLWSYQVHNLGFYTLEVVSSLLSSSPIITLDGLAASGKSSVAKGMALVLGMPFISSGLLYRLVALAALETQTEATAEAALLEMLSSNQLRFEANVGGNAVFLNHTDVTALCHSSKVDALVSVIAQHPQIRVWVNTQIQKLEPPFVAEGRDMGTNVFPNAAVKIFLTASSLVRAKRRVTERSRSLAEVQASLETRDAMDAINSAPATDATILDSSDLSLEQTVQQALKFIQDKLG